jgi:hypothetical protein
MVGKKRRAVLKSVGAGSAAMLSGCTGFLDDEGSSSGGSSNDAPGYRDWFPTASALESSDSGYLYGVFDVAALAELQGDEETEAESTTSEDSQSDPLVTNPFGIYLAAAFLSFSYSQMGLSPVIEGMDDGSSPVDRWILVGGYSVFEGSFDTDELESEFDQGGYDDPSEVGDFSLYEHPEDPYAVGVRSDTVVAVSGQDIDDAGGIGTAIIDAGRGEATRQHEESDTFDRISRAVTDGDLVYGVLPETETFEEDAGSEDFGYSVSPFAGATGLSQGLTIDPDSNRATARAGVVYESEDDVDTDRLESGLGNEANEFDLQQDGREVSIEATYEADDVSG